MPLTWEEFEKVDMLGAYDERHEVILLRPDVEVSPGARIG